MEEIDTLQERGGGVEEWRNGGVEGWRGQVVLSGGERYVFINVVSQTARRETTTHKTKCLPLNSVGYHGDAVHTEERWWFCVIIPGGGASTGLQRNS